MLCHAKYTQHLPKGCIVYLTLKTYWPIGVLSGVLLVAQLIPDLLYYERIRNGEYWRFITGHFTHSNYLHLLLNLVGLWLWATLQPTTLSIKRVLSLSLLLALSISMLFWFTLPTLQWYVGFSGILYSLFGAWAIYLLYTHDYFLGGLFSIALVAKTLWDANHSDNLSQQLIGVPVVYQAHFYGLLLSPFSALWLYRRESNTNTQA